MNQLKTKVQKMSNIVVNNVRQLLSHYGNKVNTDKKLLLVYWQQIDGVEMDKKSVSTSDFIKLATSPETILGAKLMLECIEKG